MRFLLPNGRRQTESGAELRAIVPALALPGKDQIIRLTTSADPARAAPLAPEIEQHSLATQVFEPQHAGRVEPCSLHNERLLVFRRVRISGFAPELRSGFFSR